MTPQALTRIRKAYLPMVVFVPSAQRLRYDSPQRSVDRYVGYRALWMKVIIRAAFDWVSYRDSTKLELRKEAEKAYKWLFESSLLFNSFENVCSIVDLPPDMMRYWVRSLTREHVAKIEHLERESSGISLLAAERKLIAELYGDEDA